MNKEPSDYVLRKNLMKAKKCPWCGSREMVYEYGKKDRIFIMCLECNYKGKKSRTPKLALEKWNNKR